MRACQRGAGASAARGWSGSARGWARPGAGRGKAWLGCGLLSAAARGAGAGPGVAGKRPGGLGLARGRRCLGLFVFFFYYLQGAAGGLGGPVRCGAGPVRPGCFFFNLFLFSFLVLYLGYQFESKVGQMNSENFK